MVILKAISLDVAGAGLSFARTMGPGRGFRSVVGTLQGKHGTGLRPGRSRSHSRFHHARAPLGAWSGLPRATLAMFTRPRAGRDAWP